MDQGAFAATQFALMPTILPAKTSTPDFSMTVEVFQVIFITIDFKKSRLTIYEP